MPKNIVLMVLDFKKVLIDPKVIVCGYFEILRMTIAEWEEGSTRKRPTE